MMFAKCDGCGKEAPAVHSSFAWHKPRDWFERTPIGESHAIQACSRGCITIIEDRRKAENKQSTTVVLPI